MMHCQANIR